MQQQQQRFEELLRLREERSRELTRAIEELDKDLAAEQQFREEHFGPDVVPDEPEVGCFRAKKLCVQVVDTTSPPELVELVS